MSIPLTTVMLNAQHVHIDMICGKHNATVSVVNDFSEEVQAKLFKGIQNLRKLTLEGAGRLGMERTSLKGSVCYCEDWMAVTDSGKPARIIDLEEISASKSAGFKNSFQRSTSSPVAFSKFLCFIFSLFGHQKIGRADVFKQENENRYKRRTLVDTFRVRFRRHINSSVCDISKEEIQTGCLRH